MRPTPATLLVRLHRFAAHDGGATAIVVVLMFPVVIGGLGLGAETGYWYLTQRKLQHVADVSAHAAGTRLRADDTDQQVIAAARDVAGESGYRGTPELIVNLNYGDDPLMVEVIATDTQPRLFSAVVAGFFSSDPELNVTISARAVAQVDASEASRACVLALSTTATRAITVTGTSTLTLEGCDLASNSNAGDALYVTSDATTGCAFSVGGAYTPGLQLTKCDEVRENAPLVRDPYAHIAEPADLGTIPCEKVKGGGVGKPNETTPLMPEHPHESGVPAMRFCGDLNAKGTVSFGPGLYIIEGTLRMNSSNEASQLTGEGVTFYFPDGGEMLLTGTTLDLAAPATGPFAGLLVFGSRSATATNHIVAGNNDSVLTGAVYTPASDITISGNAAAIDGGCTQVIGNTVTLTGNAVLQTTCNDAGTIEITTNEMVGIVE